MDLLIKGEWIKLPSKDDYLDIRLYGTGEVVINGDLDREAKAIPVPEHGRLCDFDKFYEYIDYYLCKNCEKACSDCDVPWIKNVISQVPTVLEANNGLTN